MADKWIDVDRHGWRQMMAQRPKWFVLTEPIQNAWDEPSTTLDIDFRHIGRSRCELVVTDDSPKGVEDIADLYTLFKPSKKKRVATLRGWMNKGCKDVLAFVVSGNIITTTGSVTFLETGDRARGRKKRKVGTQLSFVLDLSREGYEEACSVIPMLHVPAHITMTFNGQLVPHVEPIKKITDVILPTLLPNESGNMTRRTQRKTEVWVYEVPEGQDGGYIYEMGIPIVVTGDKYHYDVQQRVLLNSDRDNVTQAYLQTLRVLMLNAMWDKINDPEDIQANWAREAASDSRCSDEAIKKSLDLRFGEKRVSADLYDSDANGVAFSNGCAIIHGRNLSKGEWANAKRAGAVVPAGQVYPTFSGFVDCPQRPYEDWTLAQKVLARYTRMLGTLLIDKEVETVLIEAPSPVSTVAKFVAKSGNRVNLYFNINHSAIPCFEAIMSSEASDGSWDRIMEQWDELILHEFAHSFSDNHWGERILDGATRLGAILKRVALNHPTYFSPEYIRRPFE